MIILPNILLTRCCPDGAEQTLDAEGQVEDEEGDEPGLPPGDHPVHGHGVHGEGHEHGQADRDDGAARAGGPGTLARLGLHQQLSVSCCECCLDYFLIIYIFYSFSILGPLEYCHCVTSM